MPIAQFKPTKNSIRPADSHSSWSMTDKDINPSPFGADLNLQRFKSQASLKKHFREIIDKIGICDTVKTHYPQEFLDFCELFTRHSEYPDKFFGFVDIKIGYNPEFKNQLVVYIIKNNGEIDNVSVMNNCITGKPKDNLKIAMRVSIQPQIDEYKNNNYIKVCEICGEHDRIEIDHHSEKMPFVKLYIDFMEINNLSIPTSFNDAKSHMKCFKEIDYQFKEKWIQYHKDNAILRMLCRTCNGSQPKYKKTNNTI